jgi:hypothetical protein
MYLAEFEGGLDKVTVFYKEEKTTLKAQPQTKKVKVYTGNRPKKTGKQFIK